MKHSEVLGAESANRLDAEFFDSARAETEAKLRAAGGHSLGDVAALIDERENPRVSNDTFAYVEIGAVDKNDGFVLAKRLTGGDAPSRARIPVSAGDILVSSVRPIRNQVTFCFEDLDGAIASTGFVPLRVSEGVSAELIFAFLKSATAVSQLDRRARASMYPTLSPPEVLDISLPEFSADLIESVVDAISAAAEARSNYLGAAASVEEISSDFFHSLVPPEVWDDLEVPGSAPRTRSEIFQGRDNRLDSEFFSPVFDKSISLMAEAGEVSTLSDICTLISTGRSPAASKFSSSDTGGPVILKLAALSGHGVDWDAVAFGPHDWQVSDSSVVKEGDVLFNSTAHEPNYIAHRVDVISGPPAEHKERMSLVSDLIRLRLSDRKRTPPQFVAAFIRSRIGREQMKRCVRGVRAHAYPEDVASEVVIPIPPPDVASAITEAAERAENHRWQYSSRVADAVAHVNESVEEVLGR